MGTALGESVVYLRKGPNRLGDTLMRYVVDKRASYCLDIPLYYDPFEYSEELKLSEVEYSTKKFQLPNCQGWQHFQGSEVPVKPNAFYFGPLHRGHLSVDMINEFKEDPVFMELLRETISPKRELPLVQPPKDIISVAVHVRKGIIFDGLSSAQQITDPNFKFLNAHQTRRDGKASPRLGVDYGHPLKFPPEQYYVDQIKKLANLFDYQELYVYIFTDHPRPRELVYRVKKAVNIPNITFDYRKETNRHDKNVLTDLFSMSYNFDCLIRPGLSAFSIIAHFLGDHQVVIYPTEAERLEDHIQIGGVQVAINNR